ncbi:uncharacterized protein LOC143342072 [Colletes latitarsis]|uniref:uncharacterized protein LOC143342072 n=1 Tax=Colletes latitarsis TaxID=2605962 RepID=UPI0040358F6D
MIDYCVNAKPHERSILQQYVTKYSTFYGASAIWVFLTAIVFSVVTLLLGQSLQTDAEYPFRVDYEPLRTVIFIHQLVVGLQCASIVCVNVFTALLLLFAAARFEILMVDLRAVQTIEMLIECILRYYHIRRYAQEVVVFARYTALFTTIVASFPLVLCGLQIIGRQSLTVKVPFVFLVLTALTEVFMCAWPADILMQASANAIRGLYESTWYDQPLELQKIVMYTLIPQKPIIVSVACIIPIMSLNYYCSYVGNAFSIFTALRIVMDDEDEDLMRESFNSTSTTG